MTDFAAARRNMVDCQVRPADVTDLRIISAMLDVPREQFVAPAMADLAYLDRDLPVRKEANSGRCLIKPMVLAKLIQAAEITAADNVLDVGCASGYAAALVARLAGRVIALEQEPALAEAARAALSGLANVEVATGVLTAGWPQAAPYDAIILEGAAGAAPGDLLAQLKDGGRLVCVLGGGPGAKATLFRRSGNEFGSRHLFDSTAPVLPGFVKPPEFAF